MPSDKTDFFILFFFHPDFTVGTVMATFASTVLPSTPSALPFSVMSYGVKRFRLADFTANRELHPALKIFLLCCGKLSLGSHEHPPVALSSFFRLQSYKKKCIFHYLLQKNRGNGNKKTIFGRTEVQPYIIIWCHFRGSPRLSASTLLVLQSSFGNV